jgi:hypothetical protein
LPAAHEELKGPLRVQATGCIVLGSPLYGARWDRYRYESGETGWGDEHSLDDELLGTSMAHGTDVRWLAYQ